MLAVVETAMVSLRMLVRWFLLFAVLALPAQAADAIYPTGSRVGLVPPKGVTAAKAFLGFEDRDKRVAFVIVPLPADAYADIEKSSAPEVLAKQGITLEKREDISHPLGKAFLAIGRQQADNVPIRKYLFVLATSEITVLVSAQIPEAAETIYPVDVVRAALTSVALRAEVPVEEQLSLLPFRLTELAGFRVGGVMAGRAIMLTDGSDKAATPGVDTHMVVALAPGGPSQASERDSFARDVFAAIPNLKDVRINSSEGLRLGRQQGHQIMARGRDGASGDEITIVQWLRFGGGVYLHFIGVARTPEWTKAYARFRQVRDGIDTR
jgi:hypothetical protein